MVDPFESSRRKLGRAKEHISDLERKINSFVESRPYARVAEVDPRQPNCVVFKLKLTRDLPDELALITSDAIDNLRAVLDHACYTVAISSGNATAKEAYFPFAGTVERFENALRGRCKDIPQDIYPLLRGFKPYKGGNDLLYTLNTICVTGKHKMLISVGHTVIRDRTRFNAATGYMRMPQSTWDGANNEIVIAAVGIGTQFEYDVDFQFFVTFNEVEGIDGQEVLRVLNALASEVERVLLALEAETRRLFPDAFN